MTSRGGRATTYTYNRAGDAVLTVNAAGLRTQVGYDEHGKAISEMQLSDTYPAGVTTQTVYNAVGQIIRITGPRVRNRVTGVDHQAQTVNTYNANGDLTDELTTDIAGNDQNRRTRHTFDGNDREISTVDAEGNTVRREFNATGQVAAVIDARGIRTETEFDSRGVAQKVTLKAYSSPAGGTTHDIVLSEVLSFDPIGRIFQQRDAAGRITEHTYWPGGLPLETTIVNYVAGDTADPTGAPLTTDRQFYSLNTYDEDGLLTQQVTSGGLHSAFMIYDGAGRVVETLTDAVNSGDAQTRNRQVLDGDGLVLSSTLDQLFAPALPSQSLYEYDPAGRPVKVTTKNVGGDLVTQSAYDQRGITTTVTDPRGNVTDTLSDESGRPYEVRLPAVGVEENGAPAVSQRPTSQIGYNTFGNTTNGKDARGSVASMAYDRLGRKTRIDHPNAGQGLNNVRELFSYDPSANLASQTDKRGNVTSYEYDSRNQVARTTLPALPGGNAGSGTQTVLYDDAGRPVATTDQSGASGTVTYSNMGQAILAQQLVRAAGAQLAIPTVVRMAYDLDGFMIKRVTGSSANPKTELFTPSPQGQLAESIDPNTGTTKILRNQLGQPRSVQQNGARRVDTVYDQAGRALASQLFGDDGLLVSGTSQTVDPAGNPVTMTSARNAVTTYTYDGLDRVTQIVSPAGTQGYGYDAVGNMTRSTDGRGNSTIMVFNAWNLPTTTIEPSTVADPNPGQRTFTTVYDKGGLPIQSGEPGNVQTTRTFDAWNQLTVENATQPAQQGSSVQKQFGYDAAGRLARVSSPSGDSTYTYDDRGLLVAAAGVGGTSSMSYNERGLPTSRSDGSGTATFGWQPARDQLATVTDTNSGNRSYAWNTFGQLSAESYGTALRQYGYDPAGRLSTDSLKDAGGATLAGFAYSYDVSGNVSSKTVNLPGNSQSGLHSYEYDLAERLTKWTVNGTATPYQYDAAGNRTQAGSGLYTYDARNRLQTGPGETYTYSSRGALRQSTKTGVTTSFSVDAAGRTTQSTVAGQAPVGFQYDGLDRVLNRNGAAFTYTGTAMDPTSDGTTTFSRGPDGTPLWLTKAGTTVAAGMDRHGDLAFTLNPNLTVGSTSIYDPFGLPTAKTGPGTAIGFQADWTEPSTGNVWMGARWYTPGNATFTTRDTYAGNPSTPVSLNRYTYGSNNPIRYMDPTGHYSVEDMGSNLDFSYLAGLGGGSSQPEQNLTNAELWTQYQTTA